MRAEIDSFGVINLLFLFLKPGVYFCFYGVDFATLSQYAVPLYQQPLLALRLHKATNITYLISKRLKSVRDATQQPPHPTLRINITQQLLIQIP